MNLLQYLILIFFVKYAYQYSIDRIAGGKSANKGQFPFFVQIRTIIFLNNSPKVIRCGGTLIHKEWILTAAHCFLSNFTIPPANYEKNYVRALMGSEKRALSINSPNFTIRSIKKPYLHPGYLSTKRFNDVAVALLKSPFSINNYIKIIRLPDKTTNLCPFGVIMGTGPIDFNKTYSNFVQYASLHSKTEDEVSKLEKVIKHTVFYTEVQWVKGHAMVGDSGGPFVCYYNSGLPIQYGIMSRNLKNTLLKSMITSYESVDKYLDFISSHVPLDSSTKRWRIKNKNFKNSQESFNPIRKNVFMDILIIGATYILHNHYRI